MSTRQPAGKRERGGRGIGEEDNSGQEAGENKMPQTFPFAGGVKRQQSTSDGGGKGAQRRHDGNGDGRCDGEGDGWCDSIVTEGERNVICDE